MTRAVSVIERALRHLSALFRREPWWAELWSAAAAILWAIWVLFAGSDLTHGDAYRVILGFADEAVWIASGMMLGLLHIVTVLTDLRPVRRLACGLAAWWWSVLLLSMFLMVPRAPGLALFAIMVAINMVSMVRLPHMRG